MTPVEALERTMASAAIILTLLASPALAEEKKNNTATTAQQTRNDPNRVVCRREAENASRLPKRICRTQKEWDDLAERSRAMYQQRLSPELSPF